MAQVRPHRTFTRDHRIRLATPGGFRGYRRSSLYILDCGTVWEQVNDNSDTPYGDFPRCQVLFDPSEGSYWLFVVGMDSVAEIARCDRRR